MMSSNSQQDPFRVIIVGGSIAGLTLALCLERAGIDYLVLEARDRIDPQVGASIGIFSNGARILEQLGVYDKTEQNTDAPIWYEMLTGEGTLVQKGDSLLLIHSRTGYPVAFLERRQVLQILYENISNRSRIITQKKVKTVDHIENGLLVHCEDGSVFAGDVVAGADGVHSRIRRVMWQHADPRIVLCTWKRIKTVSMFAEYRCLYGISSAVPELEAKTQYRTFNKNYSFLVHVGKDGICFWFVFEKLDKIYRPPNMPRYNDDSDPDEFVKRFLHCRVSQKVAFGALWERRTATKLAALEEAQYRHWAYDRMVCLGDSIHKMTPNIGQGGNWAIESAAALTNQLYALLEQTKGRPSIRDIAMALGHYENSRQARTREVCDTAGTATRLEAFAGFHHRLLSLYVVPYAGDMLVDVHCQAVAGAPMLNFIPPPERSLRDGTVFEAARLAERGDTVGWRMLRSLPLLAICFVGHVGHMSGRIDTRPSQVALMGDMAPLHIIGMVETLRRGNNFTFAALWPVFALVGQQNTTMPYALPVYFFLHYVQCSLDRYATPDNRHVPSHHARTIGPAVALGYLIPATSIMVNSTTQIFDGVWWQIYPFFIILVQRAFALFAHNTVAIDKIQNPTTDMKHLRRAYIVGGAVAGAVYICSVWTWCTPRLLLDTHRHLITLCSGFFWELLHFRDLKRGSRLKAGYLKVVAVLSCTTLLFGPGAAMAVGWAWREEMLANKSG